MRLRLQTARTQTKAFQIFPCGVFKIDKFSYTLLQAKKVMTFFLGMNFKFKF